jgi:hypothetical protein
VLVVSTSHDECTRSFGGGVQHRGKLLTTELGTDGFGCGDDQAEDLLLGLGGGVDRGAASSRQH